MILCGYNSAAFACRQAARYAIVHGSSSSNPCTSTTIKNIVLQNVLMASSSNVTVTTAWAPNNNPGSTVTVTVAVQYKAIIPFVGDPAVNVKTVSQMTILQ